MTKKKSALDTQVGGNHYKDAAIQPVTFITKNKIPFLEANAIKYLFRHESKGKKADLEKAIHYTQMAIEEYYPEPKVVVKKALFAREPFAKRATVKKNPSSGFKKLKPSAELQAVIGNPNPITRPKAVEKVWAHIRKYNLQNPSDRRMVMTDETLKPILGKDEVNMFELASLIGKHLS